MVRARGLPFLHVSSQRQLLAVVVRELILSAVLNMPSAFPVGATSMAMGLQLDRVREEREVLATTRHAKGKNKLTNYFLPHLLREVIGFCICKAYDYVLTLIYTLPVSSTSPGRASAAVSVRHREEAARKEGAGKEQVQLLEEGKMTANTMKKEQLQGQGRAGRAEAAAEAEAGDKQNKHRVKEMEKDDDEDKKKKEEEDRKKWLGMVVALSIVGGLGLIALLILCVCCQCCVLACCQH